MSNKNALIALAYIKENENPFIVFCNYAFSFFRLRSTARAVGHVVLHLREDAFSAVMDRDMSFYDSFSGARSSAA